MSTNISDTDRINWLEQEQNGLGLIHDDNQHWAVAFDGMQNVVTGDEPSALQTSFYIEKSAFKPTIREAIDHAILEQEREALGE